MMFWRTCKSFFFVDGKNLVKKLFNGKWKGLEHTKNADN